MALDVHTFRVSTGRPDGPWLCVVSLRQMRRYLTLGEVYRLFGGYQLLFRWPWHLYAGVWGYRNTKRFRRFLQERGAELRNHKSRPKGAFPIMASTADIRPRVRDLPDR